MPQQSDTRFNLHLDDGPDLEVVRFSLTEGVSRPFRLELELASADAAIDPNALLDREARFTIERSGIAERTIVIAVISNTLVKSGIGLFLGAPPLRRKMLCATLIISAAGAVGIVLG